MSARGRIGALLLLLLLSPAAAAFAGTDAPAVAGDPAAGVSKEERARLDCVGAIDREFSPIFGGKGIIVERRAKEKMIKALIDEFGKTGEVTVKAFGPNTIVVSAGNKLFMTGHYYSPKKTVVFYYHNRVVSNDCWTLPKYSGACSYQEVSGRMTYRYSYEADSLPGKSDATSVPEGGCRVQFAIRNVQVFPAPDNLCPEYWELLQK